MSDIFDNTFRCHEEELVVFFLREQPKWQVAKLSYLFRFSLLKLNIPYVISAYMSLVKGRSIFSAKDIVFHTE